MENELNTQPLDALMIRLGIGNADLVKASTEQLSFKMVNKGRKGRRLTPNIQDKILTALLKVRPELKLRPRDLFRYEVSPDMAQEITNAFLLAQNGKITYAKFIDLLGQSGVVGYTVEVGPNRITYHGTAGKAHVQEGTAVSRELPGRYDESRIRLAIADAQQKKIDHHAFLKRIYDAGVSAYEVNVRRRKIEYKGDGVSYKESIPPAGAEIEVVPVKTPEKPLVTKAENIKLPVKKTVKKKASKKFRKKGMTRKARTTLKKVRSKRRKRSSSR